MGIKIEGLDDLINTLESSSENFEREGEKLINKVCNQVLTDVKADTPVAHKNGGTLRDSWQMKKITKLSCSVYNNVHYAPHVEYGHRTRLGMSKSENYKPKDGAIDFVPGVFMLKNAVDGAEKELGKESDMFIENLWREE